MLAVEKRITSTLLVPKTTQCPSMHAQITQNTSLISHVSSHLKKMVYTRVYALSFMKRHLVELPLLSGWQYIYQHRYSLFVALRLSMHGRCMRTLLFGQKNDEDKEI